MERRLLLAAVLVKDINPLGDADPSAIVEAGAMRFFSADDGTHGRELWKTDGTAAGTEMVADLWPGSSGSAPANLVSYQGKLYFTASTSVEDAAIWSSDGTPAGTTRTSIPQTGASNLTLINGRLVFTAWGGLWASDGTPANTLALGSGALWGFGDFTTVGATLFFTASDSATGKELYATDGTPAGTRLVRDIWAGSKDSFPGELRGANGKLFFAATTPTSDRELWISDGTTAGTAQVKDINTAPASSSPSPVVSANGLRFFTATDPNNSKALWKTDGTAAGTVLVTDPASGVPLSPSSDLLPFNNALYFVHAGQLWKTDGTPANTAVIQPTARRIDPNSLSATGGKLYFINLSIQSHAELWSSDGTNAGTALVKDLYPATFPSFTRFVQVNDAVLFVMNQSGTGLELWKTDGTPNGTGLLKDIMPGALSSGPRNFTLAGNTLFFTATDITAGLELWKTDGTANGTLRVKDIRPGATSSSLANLTAAGSGVFFTADNGTNGLELWKSDGTSAGTSMVADLKPGAASSALNNLVNVNGTLFFANEGSLWKSDGTPANTLRVTTRVLDVSALKAVGAEVYFSGRNYTDGFELWKSDGTSAGTVSIADALPGPAGEPLQGISESAGLIFFSRSDIGGLEPWVSDGTPAGTRLLKDVNAANLGADVRSLGAFNNTLYFSANSGTTRQLWKTDGTPTGTLLLKDNLDPQLFASAGATLVFTAYNPSASAVELWKTDGTPAGTLRLYGPLAAPSSLLSVDNRVYFINSDATSGAELWSTTGTAASTALALDLNPGPADSNLANLLNHNGVLFFTANDGLHGAELFRLTQPPVPSAGGPYALAEGASVVLAGSATGFAPLRFEWDLDGDGLFGETGPDAARGDELGPAPTFNGANVDGPATLNILLRVTDADSLSATASATLNVASLPPTATFSATPSADEGAPIQLSFSAPFDPSPADVAAGFRFSFDLNGDGVFEVIDSPQPTYTATLPENGAYTARARIRDKDGAFTLYTAPITIQNVPPTATLLALATLDEGQSATVSFSAAFDPSPGDTAAGFLYSFDLDGDGTFEILDVPTASQPFVFPDDGLYTINGRIKDRDGGSTLYTTSPITVRNVKPAISLSGSPTASEGDTYTLTLANPTDPGLDTVSQYIIDWGDGASETFSTPGPKTHIYPDGPAQPTIRISLVDEDGTHADLASHALDVLNVAPTLALSGNASVNEGLPYTLTLGAITDPGLDQVSQYTIDWGDGASDSFDQAPPSQTQLTHTYADGPAVYTIRLSLLDEDGAHDLFKRIDINNLPPALTLSGPPSSWTTQPYTLSLSSSDGAPDTITAWRITWGDGAFDTIAGNPASVVHTYHAAGNYTILASATDEDGTHPANSLPLTVLPAVGTLTGSLFDDADANATRDPGEAGLAGWRVYVDANANAAFDPTEPSALTDALGQYTLPNVPAGTVALRYVLPAGWRTTRPASGLLATTLELAQTLSNLDFAATQQARLSGRLYNDVNANAAAEPTEGGLSNWTLFLDANDNAALDPGEASTLTDSSGAYAFNLAAGTHRLRALPPAGWRMTQPASGALSVTLAAGQILAGRDLGSTSLASLRGVLFDDANLNGLQDPGENPLPNRQAFLDADRDGILDPTETALLTDNAGAYSFPALPAGSYRLAYLLPTGWLAINPAVPFLDLNIANGQVIANQDFALVRSASVSGTLFADANPNGIREPGEIALANWRVYLDLNANAAFDPAEPSTLTDAGGAYTLSNLRPGPYILRQVPAAGWKTTTPAAGFHSLNLAEGASATARDFGAVQGASITGTLFNDLNANGLQELGETGLSGFTLFLDTDNDGALDPGELSAPTDPQGTYRFTDLLPGTLRLRQVPSPGWRLTAPAGGFLALSLTAGQALSGKDFANNQGATVTGTIFNDANANATRDGAETALSNQRIYIDANDNAAFDPTETFAFSNSFGLYTFSNLQPGTYRLRQVLSPGWKITAPAAGYVDLTLTGTDTNPTADFGNLQAGSIAGSVFADANADGLRAPAETGLPDFKLFLDADNDGALDPTETTLLTDASGNFRFEGLPAGKYRLRQILSEGFFRTRPAADYLEVNLAAGQASTANNFGNARYASISGSVFADANANGLLDPAESPLEGWQLFLDANSNGLHDPAELTATTDPAGNYAFPAVPPGLFGLRLITPEGWTPTAPAGSAQALQITPGQALTDKTFLAAQCGAISGGAFADLSGEGKRDSAEPPLANQALFLDSNRNGRREPDEPLALTDPAGRFLFTQLLPGTYRLRPLLPPAFRPSTLAFIDLSVLPGGTTVTLDLGLTQKALLTGTVFNDLNANKKKNPNEKGLPRLRVYIDLNKNARWDRTEPSTLTNAQGNYALPLSAGKYTLRLVLPKGFKPTTPKQPLYTLTLKPAQILPKRDFGARK